MVAGVTQIGQKGDGFLGPFCAQILAAIPFLEIAFLRLLNFLKWIGSRRRVEVAGGSEAL